MKFLNETSGGSSAGYKNTRSPFPPSSPKVNDTWEEINDYSASSFYPWVWNGTYWIGQDVKTASYSFATLSTSGVLGGLLSGYPPVGNGFFFMDYSAQYFLDSAHDSSNYYQLKLNNLFFDGLFTPFSPAGYTNSGSRNLNIYVPANYNYSLLLEANIIGNPSYLKNGIIRLNYRYAKQT